MALDAERVVTIIEADTTRHDARIRTSAQVVEQAATEIERSANRAEAAIKRAASEQDAALARSAQRTRLLGFQIADVGSQLAAGSSPFLIIAQQAPQMANALDGATGVAGRMATFFSGPWGAALLAGGSVLAIFGARLLNTRNELEEASNKLEENARKAEIARQAQEIFGRTLPGIEAAIRSETEALRLQNTTLQENQQLSLQAAQGNASRLEDRRNRNLDAQQRQLAAISQLEAQVQGSAADPRLGPNLRSQLEAARAELQRLRAENAQIQADLQGTQREITEAQIQLSDTAVEGRVDAVAAATNRYAEALANVRREFRAGAIDQAEYERRREAAVRQRDREIEAARQAQREGRSSTGSTQFILPVNGRQTGSFGEQRPGHRHGGVDLAVPVGTQVRAAAGGTIIEQGTLPGYGNVTIIDHGGGTTTRYAHLSQFLGSVGQRVEQGQVIALSGGARGAPGAGNSQGAHLHFEVRRGGQAVPFGGGRFPTDEVGSAHSAERLAEQQARLAEQRARNEAAFQDELAQLDERLLQTRQRGVQTEEERFEFERQAIEAARERQNAQYEEGQRQGRLTEAQRDALIAKNDEIALQLQINAQLEEWQRLDEQRLDLAVTEIRSAESVEQARGQLLRTVAERRESELRLLEYAHQEELLAIERQRLNRDLNDAQRADLDRQEAAANARYAIGREVVRRRNLTPLEEFIDRAPQSAAQLDEALENVAANGLSALNDGLAEAVGNFLHLGGVAGRIVTQMITDLVRLLAYRNLTAPFAQALGLGASAALGGLGGGTGGFAGAAPGFATGGSITVGGNGGVDRNVLSLNGRPIARVSQGENINIVPQGRANLGTAGTAAMPQQPAQPVARVQLMLSDDIEGRIAAVSGPIAVEIFRSGAPGVIAAAKAETIRDVSRPRLNRG